MFAKRITIMLSLLAAATGLAATTYPVINPAQFNWVPKVALPPGAFGAVVRGDPHQGPYAFFGRFPANFVVPMHWHTNDVAVVMTEGAMVIKTEDGSQRIDQGGYFFLPGSMKYVAECVLPCTFLAWGEKPFDIVYSNSKDDPRLKQKK